MASNLHFLESDGMTTAMSEGHVIGFHSAYRGAIVRKNEWGSPSIGRALNDLQTQWVEAYGYPTGHANRWPGHIVEEEMQRAREANGSKEGEGCPV